MNRPFAWFIYFCKENNHSELQRSKRDNYLRNNYLLKMSVPLTIIFSKDQMRRRYICYVPKKITTTTTKRSTINAAINKKENENNTPPKLK